MLQLNNKLSKIRAFSLVFSYHRNKYKELCNAVDCCKTSNQGSCLNVNAVLKKHVASSKCLILLSCKNKEYGA